MQQLVRQLAEQQLAGTRVNVPGFIDQLLELTAAVNEVRCTLVGRDGLRFEVPGQGPWEVPLDHAKAKLRSMCARVAVLCREGGQDVSLYGGTGVIERSQAGCARRRPQRWTVRFRNTPSEQELTLTLCPE
jgi:hypothetical protein